MHILLIHQAFAEIDEPGGTRHHELARRLVARGHQVTVLTGQVSYLTGARTAPRSLVQRESDDVGVEIWRCWSYAAWHRSFLHRTLSFISFMLSAALLGLTVRGVDVVWGTSPPIFQGFTAWLLSRLKRVPLLFEVRDLWPYFAIEVGVLRQPLLIRLSEWLEGFLYRKAAVVVVNSPGYVEHVAARGGRDVRLVPNGVDLTLFPEGVDGAAFRAANRLEGKFVVMYAGAHGMSNDLGIALQTAVLLEDEPEVRFVFVGDGKEKAALLAAAEAMGLENVLFLPPVSKNEMAETLAGADACLAILKPIKAYALTYPNKVFDYMAAGKPVLLMIDGVVREVVEEAGAGLFVAPGDPQALAEALRTLRSDPEKAAEMGRRGRAFVAARFSRAALAEDLETIFLDLVAGRGGQEEAA